MANHEINQFIELWEHEAGLTKDLLKSIPEDKYDFRPDPEGRSMGELAWHLAELEAIFSTAARDHNFKKIPGLERPGTVSQIVSGYERVHRESVERVRVIKPAELDLEVPFIGGRNISVRNLLRFPLLHHLIHPRGQLMMTIRIAGAVPARVYGPNREDTVAART